MIVGKFLSQGYKKRSAINCICFNFKRKMFKSICFANLLGLLGIVNLWSGFIPSFDSENGDISSTTITNARSVYTSIESDNCQAIEIKEEDYYISRCLGYDNIPVFIKSTQHTRYLKIGDRGDLWESHFPSFNSLGKVVEWRLKNEKPFAAIYRHNVYLPIEMFKRISYLGIIKISKKGDNCIMAFVDGSLPKANEIARNYADKNTTSFICGEQKTETIRLE